MHNDLKKNFRYEYLVFLLILAGILFSDTFPLLKKLAQLSQEIYLTRRIVEASPQEAIEKQKRILQSRLSEIKEKSKFIHGLMGSVPQIREGDLNVASLSVQVEDVVKAAGIDFKSLSPQELKSGAFHSIVPLEITFESDYAHLIDLLARIEAVSTYILVENVTILGNEQTYPILNIRLLLHVLVGKTDEKGTGLSEEKSFRGNGESRRPM